MKIKIFMIAVITGIFAAYAFAELPSVDEIVAKANHMSLYQGRDSRGRVDMVITDKQGRVRKRAFNMLRRNDDNRNQDQKYFVFFQAPADVRKMVFMVHKHAALEKDDDRWLYMPSLDLVKRIASSDKRTSFVGSDFLYEDISGRNPLEDIHELIGSTEQYYVLKNTPKNSENVEFEYYTAYIDKKNYLPVKMEYFKENDRLYRIITSETIEPIEAEENGQKVTYPTVTRSIARDVESKTQTEMFFSNVSYNIGISDRIFTERYLRRPPRDAMR